MSEDFHKFMSLPSLSCADVEQLIDSFVDGELPEELQPRFAGHLASCAQCETVVEDVRKIVEAARNLRSHVIPFGVRERLREHLNEELNCQLPTRPKLSIVK